ncbi:hypothetical protein Lesp02_75090 [Lentzea sp. NBRC 105346]|nr:hypothetical protein Lesp02_75090 [Lentzea sp. NBRC 105346]
MRGDLDRITEALWSKTRISRRVSAEELVQWLQQRNPSAADPRCPICALGYRTDGAQRKPVPRQPVDRSESPL